MLRQHHCIALLVGLVMSPIAVADVVAHDNRDQMFLWVPYYESAPFWEHAYLDILQPPTQSWDETPWSLLYVIGSQDTSMEIVVDAIRSSEFASVAQDPGYMVGGSGIEAWIRPPTPFQPGDMIGPDANWQNLSTSTQYSGDTSGYDRLLDDHGYIGVRLEIAGVYLYGWVELEWGTIHDPHYASMYFPQRWAFENEPNMPIYVAAIFVDDDADPGGRWHILGRCVQSPSGRLRRRRTAVRNTRRARYIPARSRLLSS